MHNRNEKGKGIYYEYKCPGFLIYSFAIDAERVPALQKFLRALGLLHLTILVQIIVFGMLKSKTNER